MRALFRWLHCHRFLVQLDGGGTLQGTGANFCSNIGTSEAEEGLFDINIPGVYTFYAECSCSGCVSDRVPFVIEVFADAELGTPADIEISCTISASGNVSLSSLFIGSDPGGTYTLVSSTGTGSIMGGAFVYSSAGCFTIEHAFSSGDAGPCPPQTPVQANVLISEEPQPSFTIQDQICFSNGDPATSQQYTPFVNSPDYDGTPIRTWSVMSGPATIINAATGQIQITGIGTVVLCLDESIAYDACGSLSSGSCVEQFCVSIDVQDGTSLDASFVTDEDNPCIGDVVNLTPVYQGGLFTGTGVVDNGMGTGGTFTPSGCGTFAVSYTLNSANGCSNTFTINIETDPEAPTITTPVATAVECDGAGNTSDLSTWLMTAMVNDNCADPTSGKSIDQYNRRVW